MLILSILNRGNLHIYKETSTGHLRLVVLFLNLKLKLSLFYAVRRKITHACHFCDKLKHKRHREVHCCLFWWCEDSIL